MDFVNGTYKVGGMMLLKKFRRKIDLDQLYSKLGQKYDMEYNPEVSNRLVVHIKYASVLVFNSGTIQLYLRDPRKADDVIHSVNEILQEYNTG